MTFADRLKELREEKGVTQQELANYLGVGRPTVAGYETKNKQPDFEKLINIAKYFNVPTDYLLGISDSRIVYHAAEEHQAERHVAEGSATDYNVKPSADNEDDVWETQLAANMEAEYGQKPSPEMVAMAKKIYKSVLKEIADEEATKKNK